MPFLCSPLTSHKSSPDGQEIAPVRCKRWDCPHCHQLNRKRVIARAMAGKPKAMLTLTVSSEHYDCPDAAAKALKEGLRLLRLRLKRHNRFKKFEFLAVFEKHKSGYPHLHLLIRGGFIPWKWLTKVWQEITGSRGVDIRKIDTRGQAAFYVAKYIGKDLSAFAGCKRWWRSHGYNEGTADDWTPEYAHAEYSHWDVNFNQLIQALKIDGWTLEKQDRDRWRIKPPDDPHASFSLSAYGAARSAGGTGRKVTPWVR